MIAVVVATIGRPDLVADFLSNSAKQVRKPEYLLFSASTLADMPNSLNDIVTPEHGRIIVLYGERGLPKQRNRGLDWLKNNTDIFNTNENFVVFLDDDFLMREDWLREMSREFAEDLSVIGCTGVVVADGAVTEGYSFVEGAAVLKSGTAFIPHSDWRRQTGTVETLYGCNMAVRGSALQHLCFDEALPLYGWLEDFDFSIRLSGCGTLKRFPSLVGVHLGAKKGRISGVRFGYSQIANPIYLYRKGTMSVRQAIKYTSQCIIGNLMNLATPQRYIDRRGRLWGNCKTLYDLCFGRSNPKRVLDLNILSERN